MTFVTDQFFRLHNSFVSLAHNFHRWEDNLYSWIELEEFGGLMSPGPPV